MFAEKYGPWAVIAGGSDGTGSAFARGIAKRGVNVVLVARRQAVLDGAAEAIRADFGVEVRTVSLDLSVPSALADLATATADLELGLFVFNAGADDRSVAFLDKQLEEHLNLIQRNCNAVLEASYRFGAPMVERGRGGLVLVTSGAAWVGAAHLSTYGATKAFDLILAESLWAEWHDRGVDVLSIVLAATDTPSLRRTLEGRGGDTYGNASFADPVQVAEDALEHIADGPTRITGSDELTPGSPFGAMPRRDAVLMISQHTAGGAH